MRTLIAALALGPLALTGCGGNGNTTMPATRTVAPTPTVKLDAYAQQACAKLDSAVDKRGNGDPIGANQDEFSAMVDAAQSLAPGLKELVLKYDRTGLDFDKAAPHLRAWCYTNTPS